MKAIRLTLIVGAVLVSASPVLPQFVKAALGFRLGYSPTEHGYNQKINYGAQKKGVGVQLLSGANNGGWHQGGLQVAGSTHGAVAHNGGGWHQALAPAGSNYGSGYGVGIGGGREGPLAAHVGHGAVRHLRILGLNLYLGGRAAHLGQQGLQHNKVPLKKPLHFPAIKPLSLFGIRPSVHVGLKPSGAPHTVGGNTGLRAAVGTHDYGVGFKVGYQQGINTKSPLAQVLGLGGGDTHGKYSYVPTTQKGHDQVYLHGNSLLNKGHGHNNQYSGWGHLDSPVAGLESQHHFSTQPLRQNGQLQQLQNQGPIRIPYIPQHNGRSILRPTPIQYTFNGPQQALPSGPVRMVLAPHPQSPLQQHSRPHNSARWSTIFPANNSPQPAASNHFVNPISIPNGQPLAKLQASLRSGPVANAQNQIPFIQQPQYQQQYQGHHSYDFQGPFAQPTRHQNNFNQNYNYLQQSTVQRHQFPQEYNLFQQQNLNSLLQSYQHNAPSHFPLQQQQQQQQQQQHNNLQHSQSQIPQQPQSQIPQQSQSPFFNQIQEQHLSSPQQLDQPAQQQHQAQSFPLNTNFPNLPQIPFTTDSMQFQPDPGFQYTHSTSSDPVSMGSYTMDMDLGQASGSDNSAGQLVGPLGRRLKKAKRARADVIIKKSDTVVDTKDMETTASPNNAILMASSLGATSWTPLVIADKPVATISKKSLETAPAPIPENSSHQAQEPDIKSRPQVETTISEVVPTTATSVEHSQDRSMILKKRRLNTSGEVTGPTVIPTTSFPTTTISFTTTTTPTTITTTTAAPTTITTTTPALPSSSTSSISLSSLAPSSSTSSANAESEPESTSASSSLTTVIV